MYFVSDRYKVLDMNEKIVFGKFYKARDLQEDNIVLIQIIRDNKHIRDNFLPNFIDESTMLVEINSPHIAKILDVGMHTVNNKECFYIVNEYFCGIELSKVIRGNYMDLNSIVNITRTILKTLGETHIHDLYHGALNESNIFVDEYYNIKIYDFCITKANKGINIRKDGDITFLSPHQLNINYTDKESDFFTLGIILFDAIFKKMPFGDAKTESEMLKLIDKGIDWNSAAINDENAALVNMVKKLIRRKEKYESASDALVDLSKFMYAKADIIDEVDNIITYNKVNENNTKSKNEFLKKAVLLVLAMSTLATVIAQF
ncbi:MAG: protein kinase [Terrisporobacter sp.]|uniref:protein kinase domain-containing protein n=1 Tax=Terrisporobacter sp. TaxID=1965305 RepID=UPI002FC7FEE0